MAPTASPLALARNDGSSSSCAKNASRVESNSPACCPRLRVAVAPGVPDGLAVVEGVHWARDTEGGRNVNVLTSQRLTDEGAGSTFYDNRVDLRPEA